MTPWVLVPVKSLDSGNSRWLAACGDTETNFRASIGNDCEPVSRLRENGEPWDRADPVLNNSTCKEE